MNNRISKSQLYWYDSNEEVFKSFDKEVENLYLFIPKVELYWYDEDEEAYKPLVIDGTMPISQDVIDSIVERVGGNGGGNDGITHMIVNTTDTSAQIINKLTNQEASSIKFSNGEYTLRGTASVKKIIITKPIKISGDNAVVYLEGGIQIELKSPDIEISGIDFRVRNHGTLVGAESILVVRRNNIKIDRCKFSGTEFYYGIFIEDNELKNCDDVSITNCKSCCLYGIWNRYRRMGKAYV